MGTYRATMTGGWWRVILTRLGGRVEGQSRGAQRRGGWARAAARVLGCALGVALALVASLGQLHLSSALTVPSLTVPSLTVPTVSTPVNTPTVSTPDGNDADHHRSEGHGADRHGPDRHGPEGHGSEGHGSHAYSERAPGAVPRARADRADADPRPNLRSPPSRRDPRVAARRWRRDPASPLSRRAAARPQPPRAGAARARRAPMRPGRHCWTKRGRRSRGGPGGVSSRPPPRAPLDQGSAPARHSAQGLPLIARATADGGPGPAHRDRAAPRLQPPAGREDLGRQRQGGDPARTDRPRRPRPRVDAHRLRQRLERNSRRRFEPRSS